jgi:CBS domain-containing protein
MTIDQILNDKGREIISVKADSTLSEAARILDEKRIGAVVALGDGGEIVGVLSERDIVRHVARNGAKQPLISMSATP